MMPFPDQQGPPVMARPRKPVVRLKLPPHVHRTVSRGKEYFSFQQGRGTRAAGLRIKLPHLADPAFWPTYYAISNTEVPKPAAGTFAALVAAFRGSHEWLKDLAEKTKVEWDRYLDRIEKAWGPFAV